MFFSVSNIRLTVTIPDSICNVSGLQVLDLSSNNMSGRMPSCLFEAHSSNSGPSVLNLKNNRFFGTIPDNFPSNCSLQTLSLNGNQLGGSIPKSIVNCKSLEVLDI